jgi:hypothetical protein
MRRKPWAFLALVMLLVSCATDGGSSGTGITSVEGNVAGIANGGATMSALATGTPTNLAGIEVIVEDTPAAAETDADGRFVVRGKFDGRATLRFRRAADALSAQMTIVVPRGGTLTLHDVQIDVAADAAVAANRHAVFDALVAGADCGAGTLSLVSIGGAESGYVYKVDLASAFIHDGDGTAVDCGELRASQRVHVEAVARPDGSFQNADVEVEQ